MEYKSILFKNTPPDAPKPGFFKDLNIDQIVESITASKKKYDLEPYFTTPLTDIQEIYYRHEIMKDLEDRRILSKLNSFSREMESLFSRIDKTEKLQPGYYKKGRHLHTAELYIKTVTVFAEELSFPEPKSQGLCFFRDYINSYILSEWFSGFTDAARSIRKNLSEIKYSIYIKGSRIEVRKHGGEHNYAEEIEKVFGKFRRYSDVLQSLSLRDDSFVWMNHIEAEILSMVADLYPETFHELDRFTELYSDFIDTGIKLFNREIQFHISYTEYISGFKHAGLSFCYPEVVNDKRNTFFKDSFDMALGKKLIREKKEVVRSNFTMKDRERIFIVTGVNQGGKTTFARTFGQMHYMASLGFPVPGTGARLYNFDKILTHFEKEETVSSLKSKLEDDLSRIRDILKASTPKSIIILNESLSSTTLHDTVLLGKRILRQISDMDAICLWITFADELSAFNEKTVSMVTELNPSDPSVRTYRIIRKKADGKAYAMMIAEKNHLTYRQIIGRIK